LSLFLRLQSAVPSHHLTTRHTRAIAAELRSILFNIWQRRASTKNHGGTHEKFPPDEEGVVRNILIKNNLIYDATRIYWGHAAITAFFTDGLTIENNQIQNTKYTGVSLGWSWNNFAPEQTSNPTTVARNNKFNNNRIFNVMTDLRDGGAFYTLGNQPNSEANGNYVKAPTTHFQGVYHPDEGTAYYTGKDLVFEILPGQDNFELNVWRDKHDNNYDNIFTTSSSNETGAPNSSITNMHVFPDGDWPAEARNIISNAGLQAGYQHLLDGIPEPPSVPGVAGIDISALPVAPDDEVDNDGEDDADDDDADNDSDADEDDDADGGTDPDTPVAPTEKGNFKIVKRNAPGFAIDGDSGGVAGRSVELYDALDHNNLTWTEIDLGNDYVAYQKFATSVCLDGGNGGANKQDVKLETCDSSDINQQWLKVDLGNGYYQVQKRGTNFSLDGGNGGARDQNVYLWSTDTNNQNQHWRYDPRP